MIRRNDTAKALNILHGQFAVNRRKMSLTDMTYMNWKVFGEHDKHTSRTNIPTLDFLNNTFAAAR